MVPSASFWLRLCDKVRRFAESVCNIEFVHRFVVEQQDSLLTSLSFGEYRFNQARNTNQWRAQKIFNGAVHSMAYGGHLYLVCAVCDVTI